jgi:hypothetical protein
MAGAWARAGRVGTAFWLLCAALSAPAAGDEPGVKVESGLNDAGMYVFRVTNQSSSPIVYVEIPHYLADQFMTPRNWKQECTFLSNIGVEKRPGLCSATAESPIFGIGPGETAEFSMRMGLDGRNESRRGEGTMKVRFADDRSVIVAGVSVPVKPPEWENWGLIGGYVVIGLILLAIFARRRPKAKGAAPEEGQG